MSGYITNIESDTLANEDYRRVLFTGTHSQLGTVVLNGVKHRLSDGVAVVIPAGVEHNVINTYKTEPLLLYTLHSPPEHPIGTIHCTKRDEIETRQTNTER